MTVPNLVGDDGVHVPAPAAGSRAMSGDQLTILAVDDERTSSRIWRSAAHSPRQGGRVRLRRPRRAVKASTQAYDAIFLDVRMPNLDGLELGRVLRRFATPPQLVFVSAYDNAAVDAFELHALDYLRKPVGRRRGGGDRASGDGASPARVTPGRGASSPPAGGRGGGGADPRSTRLSPANLHGGSMRSLARRRDPRRPARRDLRPDRHLCHGRHLLAGRRWARI